MTVNGAATATSAQALLDDGELHLWLMPVRYDVASTRAPLTWLDATERKAFDELLFERDRMLYAQAHGWLRRILGEYLGCAPPAVRLRRDARGKPLLAARDDLPSLRFNLSHTHSAVLVGVCTRAEPGVDIERVRPLKDFGAMARAVLHPCEQRSLAKPMPPQRRLHDFFRVWTAKEAYTKALGTGLMHGLREVVVVLEGQTTCWVDDLAAATRRSRPLRGWSAVLECDSLGAHYAVSAVSVGGPARVVLHAMPGDACCDAPLRPTVLEAGALSH
jgi:4'-phosphopantetheinyl transferase